MLDVKDILCIASAINELRRDARRSLPSMSTDAMWSRNAKLLAQNPKFHGARCRNELRLNFVGLYFAFAFAASLTSRLKKAAVIPKARE